MKKKTVFKGVINGKEFNNVQDYNKELTALVKSGASFSANTTTETVEETANTAVNESTCLLPYFSDSEYYLDKILTVDPKLNEENIEKMEKTLTYNYNLIKSGLSTMSDNEIKKYIDSILNIMKNIDRDEKHNKDAQQQIKDKVKVAQKKFDTVVEAAEYEYNTAMEKFDAESEILESAEYVMKKMKEHYDKVLNLLTPNNNISNCCCCNCKNNEHSYEPIKTESKEIKKQTVTDLTSLFNKIFGIDINKL